MVNGYDWWIVGLMALAFALFMLYAAAETSEPVCTHDWTDAGVRLTILKPEAKSHTITQGDSIIFTESGDYEWYELSYYRKADLEPYQMQYCTRCGLLRIIPDAK